MTRAAVPRPPIRPGLSTSSFFSGNDLTRRTVDPSASRRYSGFVRSMRIILPVLALLTFGLILIWPGLQARVGGLSFAVKNMDNVGTDLSMVSPRLTGNDREDRPYTITAKSAIPDRSDVNRIKLDVVDGDMTLSDGTWVNLTAPFGVYDKFLKTLDLSGPISFHTDVGHEINARSAHVDLVHGTIISNEPVQLQGPFGTLEADRATLVDRGRIIYFDGHVRGVLVQARGEGK